MLDRDISIDVPGPGEIGVGGVLDQSAITHQALVVRVVRSSRDGAASVTAAFVAKRAGPAVVDPPVLGRDADDPHQPAALRGQDPVSGLEILRGGDAQGVMEVALVRSPDLGGSPVVELEEPLADLGPSRRRAVGVLADGNQLERLSQRRPQEPLLPPEVEEGDLPREVGRCPVRRLEPPGQVVEALPGAGELLRGTCGRIQGQDESQRQKADRHGGILDQVFSPGRHSFLDLDSTYGLSASKRKWCQT